MTESWDKIFLVKRARQRIKDGVPFWHAGGHEFDPALCSSGLKELNGSLVWGSMSFVEYFGVWVLWRVITDTCV